MASLAEFHSVSSPGAFSGDGTARLYDRDNRPLREVELAGRPPTLRRGANALALRAGQGALAAYATPILTGPVLRP